MFERLRKCRETHSPDSGIWALSPALVFSHLRTATVPASRGLKTHSVWMPFLPRGKISFPASCGLRVTYRFKTLAWRSFFRSKVPRGRDHRDGSHTHRQSQSNIQTSVPSHFLCWRGLVNLGLSGAFLDPAMTLPVCEPEYRN